MKYKDAWVENGRVLARLEDSRVLEIGNVSYLVMMAIAEETLIRESEMQEKYGVETEKKDPKAKEASDKGKCPECGEKLEKQANVPKCPTHGVKPFEKDG